MVRPLLTGMVALCLFGITSAQQTQQKEVQQNQTSQAQQTERAEKLTQSVDSETTREQKQNAQQTERTELPESLKQLGLAPEQEKEILAIYCDCDGKSQQLWDRVQDLHRQAINMEAAAIAAARLEGHDHSAHASHADPTSEKAVRSNTARGHQTAPAGSAERTPKTRKPVIAADDKPIENNDSLQIGAKVQVNSPEDHQPEDARTNSGQVINVSTQDQEGSLDIVGIQIEIAQPDGSIREYVLTQPVSQTEHSEKNQAFQNHQAQLKQTWKEIHECHEQLVALQADTIVNVESHLTETQLEKLDKTMTQAANENSNPEKTPRR